MQVKTFPLFIRRLNLNVSIEHMRSRKNFDENIMQILNSRQFKTIAINDVLYVELKWVLWSANFSLRSTMRIVAAE